MTNVGRTTPSLTLSQPLATAIVRRSGAAILPSVAVISDIIAPLAGATMPAPAGLLRVYAKNCLTRKDHQLKPAANYATLPIGRPAGTGFPVTRCASSPRTAGWQAESEQLRGHSLGAGNVVQPMQPLGEPDRQTACRHCLGELTRRNQLTRGLTFRQ